MQACFAFDMQEQLRPAHLGHAKDKEEIVDSGS